MENDTIDSCEDKPQKNKKLKQLVLVLIGIFFLFVLLLIELNKRDRAKKLEKEASIFHQHQQNLESRYLNSLIGKFPNSSIEIVRVSKPFYEQIKWILDQIEEGLKDLKSFEEDDNYSMTSEEERLIRNIRSDSFSSSIVTLLSPTESPMESPKEKNFFQEEDSQDSRKIKKFHFAKHVVIVTKKVAEGEPIPPLPSWTKISHTHKDYWIKKKRLNRIYINDFAKIVNADKAASSEWIELEEDLGLERLFR